MDNERTALSFGEYELTPKERVEVDEARNAVNDAARGIAEAQRHFQDAVTNLADVERKIKESRETSNKRTS